jgi:hypothetical protein
MAVEGKYDCTSAFCWTFVSNCVIQGKYVKHLKLPQSVASGWSTGRRRPPNALPNFQLLAVKQFIVSQLLPSV